MLKSAAAGNRGKDIRSDCYVEIELRKSGGIQLELTSKVDALFGQANRQLIANVLDYFDIVNARVIIEDSGALPFIMMARLEAAIRQLIDTEKEYLPELLPENCYSTARDRNRRSRLYLPGNTPKLFINAGLHKADGIILDLEDSVAPAKKDEARYLVRNALRGNNFYGCERAVRINQGQRGLQDLDYIVPHWVNIILVPKCETVEDLTEINARIQAIKQAKGLDYPVYLMPIIESAKGVLNAFAIAGASKNVVALAIGLEDYTADLGTQRTREGNESFFARSMLVNAARAAGIQPIDSVFSDVGDQEGLKQTVTESKAMGFEGMGCIHPRQVPVIHEAFAPTDAEIDKAQKIVNAFIEADEKGLGVVALGSKMIDPPVVKRAQKTIAMAVDAGKIAENWRDTYGN
ncbi:HpcH/HpaI aldolase/citrate lyase family protein [bacterium]|nr:HpcH/HpaI aldolase/citrate lyase family protein [bacterium]MBU1065553.1 HpcH/HpaI aldolase/citrate lyase family protein [bacterium]MBU1633775.1 HpcH/HpaI aldolase/citrate lyase family protein [bacterium]MBU1873526.1 HpcH/HpaI aldolase/citrate lyase family protein [bacterium]